MVGIVVAATGSTAVLAAVIGAAVTLANVAISYGLSRRSVRKQEIRDIRLALLECRDVLWDGQRAAENHIAKLRIRLHTLGYPRDFLRTLDECAARCRVIIRTAGEIGYDDEDPDSEIKTIDSSDLAVFDKELEYIDEAIAWASTWLLWQARRRRPREKSLRDSFRKSLLSYQREP